jgi:cyanophycinase
MATVLTAIVSPNEGGTVTLATAAPPAAESQRPDPKAVLRDAVPTLGSLMIIGGGARHDNHALWSDFARLAGGGGKRVAVFPCASGYPRKNGERAVKMLQGYGLDAFLVPLALTGLEDFRPEEVTRDPQWLERVRQADGIYFIGGSQGRIRDALVDNSGRATPMLDAIWDVYRRGGVVAGTSAGAAVMSRVMFRDPASILHNLQHGVRMGKDLADGLGFLDANWFVDQHCLVRGRFARVLVAMSQHGMKFGFGIDEDTAVVVERGERARIVGNRGAVVIDLSRATHGGKAATVGTAASTVVGKEESPGPFALTNARLTYLNHGDAIDLRTLEVVPSATKRAERKIDPRAADFQPSLSRKLFYTDVLANTTLVDILTRVLVHKDGLAIGLAFDGAAAADGPTPGFEFRFYRGDDSVGWETEAHGPTDSTIQNIHLDVRPIMIQGPLYRPALPDSAK